MSADQYDAPLVVIGVLADTQYADIEDGASYDKSELRFYRHALSVVDRAVEAWRASPPFCIIHLGDIVDGKHPRSDARAGLALIQDRLASVSCPVHYACGNHDFYHFSRAALVEPLGFPDDRLSKVVSLAPAPWRMVILDTYGVSLIGSHEGSAERAQAQALLDARNPNENKNSPDGLSGEERRFVAFNGAVSPAMLVWLDEQLTAASAAGDRVILVSHVPLHPHTGPGPPLCVIWNFADVLAIIERHSATVPLCLHGHDHSGGSTRLAGTTFVGIEAVLLCPEGHSAFAEVAVHRDYIEICGHGRVTSQRVSIVRPS